MTAPKYGTPEYAIWYQGASEADQARTEGMKDDARQVYESVELLGQQGESADYIIEWVAFVFTADWSWRQRLRLAWKLVRG